MKNLKVPILRFDHTNEPWKKYKLGSLITGIETGTNELGKENKTDFPLLKMGNLQLGTFNFSKLEYLTNEQFSNSQNYIVKKGDFLFNTRNTLALVGKAATWTLEAQNYIFNSNIARISFDTSKINTYFINYLYATPYIWSQVKARAVGTTSVAAVYPKDLATIKLFIPSIKEQEKISEFFEKIVMKIRLQQEKVDLLKEQKKGLMQKIFNQELRFKDQKGQYHPKWKTVKLSHFAKKIVRKNKDLAITNVISNSAKNGLISQKDYFDKEIANQENIDGYYVILQDNFVYNPRISSDAPYGPINIYREIEPGIVSPLYMCFTLENIHKEFMYYYFKGTLWHKYIYLYGDSGARHDRVSIKDSTFLEMPISVPCDEEQKQIANFFSRLENKISSEEKKLALLQQQKQAFMQQMFI